MSYHEELLCQECLKYNSIHKQLWYIYDFCESCVKVIENNNDKFYQKFYVPNDDDDDDYDDESGFPKIICADCDDIDDGYSTEKWFYKCHCCENNYCEDCRARIDRPHTSRYFEETYCEICVPRQVLDEIDKEKQDMDDYWIMIGKSDERKNELVKALEKAGIELRSDSKLCKKYIDYAIGNVHEIVERMCQMKLLFEYYDIREILKEVSLEYYEELEAGYFPDFKVFPEAERRVLEKIGNYPIYYPWQKENAAKIIQKGCENWLWKPLCKDGTIGINPRLAIKKLTKVI